MSGTRRGTPPSRSLETSTGTWYRGRRSRLWTDSTSLRTSQKQGWNPQLPVIRMLNMQARKRSLVTKPLILNWSRRVGSNHRTADYESCPSPTSDNPLEPRTIDREDLE